MEMSDRPMHQSILRVGLRNVALFIIHQPQVIQHWRFC